ncbi:MAG: hypothetical protein WC658_01450 [Candidatus Omnitrophota bacterium]
MNSIVAVSSYLLNYRILRFTNFIDSLISWILLYFSQIVITQMLLGIAGVLYLQNVIILNAGILIFIWLITRRRGSSFDLSTVKEKLQSVLGNKAVIFCIAVILGFALVKIFINLINPPVGWDSLNYHFTFPVEWLKHGNLDTPITISDDPSPSYYPINGSLLFLWLIFPFKSVFLADVSQLPFFAIGFMAVYNISRRIGLTREKAFYAAVLFFITPNFFKQLAIAYVDVMVAALFLASINFLIKFSKEFRLKDCCLWSVSYGLFMGTKTSGIVFGVLPFLFFIFIICKNASRLRRGKIVTFLLLFFALSVALGGFSYIKNYIETGDPLYPADIKIFGRHIFKGVMPFSTYRNRWTKEEFHLEKLLFHEGMGAQFLLLVMPAIFLSLPLYMLRRRKDRDRDVLFILALAITLYFSFWNLMPQLWVRYLYPLLGIGFVAGMYFLELLKVPLKAIKIFVILCVLGSMTELARYGELIVSLILSLFSFLFLPRILGVFFNKRTLTLLALFLVSAVFFISIDYQKHEFGRYLVKSRFPKDEKESWVWMNAHVDGARIAYVGRPDVLPLYGSRFKNDVMYISVNRVHPAKLHYFPHGRYVWVKDFMTLHQNLEKEGNYRENADYGVWLGNLNREKIDYLIVYSLHQVKPPVFPAEDNWAKGSPKNFSLVFNNSEVHIYKIIK